VERVIRLVFNKPMNPTFLLNEDNYTISGSSQVIDPIVIDEISIFDECTVDLHFIGNVKTGDENYKVVVNNLTDIYGKPINEDHDEVFCDGIGIPPDFVSTTIIDSDTVSITFSTEMERNTVENLDNYELFIMPEVSGAAYVAIRECTITFSEPMDSITAQTIGNYSLTHNGNAGPNVITANLVDNVVTLGLDSNLESGEYRVHVRNIEDLFKNVINPLWDSAVFTI